MNGEQLAALLAINAARDFLAPDDLRFFLRLVSREISLPLDPRDAQRLGDLRRDVEERVAMTQLGG